ncbi:unnamed protein product [Acanthoscelides obtectus]|uniref:Secreted protein n=1 Tax=Acanthoscelides obtectus TaxID=200917 RepID=A0A9P0PQB0_ACAOB|nr:unnamed protein product [Acanthoscelides obtectus]CAH1992885.1 unnamed protein product [Acanthoscelides obtectus]CAK1658886.1 hypothetical protein AOBTE_LOCUS21185 [Acanthoscelides obtectus]CAK1658889.1 hypothetical protein AOBTE_LOCUS21185 [Acanthoscelides obtectus]
MGPQILFGLLLALYVAGTHGMLHPYYSTCETGTCTCTASTCGRNAQCSIVGGRPVCSCLRGHSGDPLTNCIRLASRSYIHAYPVHGIL